MIKDMATKILQTIKIQLYNFVTLAISTLSEIATKNYAQFVTVSPQPTSTGTR